MMIKLPVEGTETPRNELIISVCIVALAGTFRVSIVLRDGSGCPCRDFSARNVIRQ